MSAVWRYYSVEGPQSKTATCNVCKAAISMGGSSVSAYNTTNLFKHLKKHHVNEHREFVASSKEDDTARRQGSLVDSFQKQSILPADNVQAKAITGKLLNFIVAEENDTDSGIKTMKSTLLDAVNRRFLSIEGEPLYAVATLVDARYKDR